MSRLGFALRRRREDDQTIAAISARASTAASRLRADPSWRSLPAALVRRIELWLWLDGDAELLITSDRSPRDAVELERYRALRNAGFAT